MLVLSRKPNESISIGNDITVTVLRTTSGGVRLGIEAPPDVNIVRSELHRAAVLPDLLNESFVHPGGRPADDIPRRIHERPVVDEALPASCEGATR
ncbi:MAG: carbon storage regulator [Planctomycetaceae bacterium]